MHDEKMVDVSNPWLSPGMTVGLLDESGTSGDGRPLLAGITLTDDLAALNRAVDDARATWTDSYALEGNRNYGKFERKGFHYSTDPLPVIQSFVATIGALPNVRSILCFSDRSRRPPEAPDGIGDTERLLLLYLRLVETALRYCRTSELHMIFEENSAIPIRMLETVARRATDRSERDHPGRTYPKVTIAIGSKGNPSALSVIDYIMAVFARWQAEGSPTDPQSSAYQQYRAVERNIAAIEDVDHGLRSNRRNRAFH